MVQFLNMVTRELRGMIKKIIAITGISVMLSTSPALAVVNDSLIEGAKLCTRHLPRYEREYGIPTHLLSAIASNESGRYHQGLKLSIPWPWTINAEGKGYYYDSKEQAVAAARKMRMQGIKSMDVGCMQVNIMHHPNAFRSIEDAFDPKTNIAYAAGFLRSLYEENKSWKTAAANYHSKTPKLGTQYVGSVYDKWYTIVSKLREARLQSPDANSFAQGTSESQAASPSLKRYDPATKQFNEETKKYAALPEQRGTKQPNPKTPRMNSITVSKADNEHASGVIVVRPEIKVVDGVVPVTASPAQAALALAAKNQPENEAAEAKVVHIENVAAASLVSPSSGPRFIFDN